MRRLFSALLIGAFLIPISAIAGWVDRDGRAIADTAERKNAAELGAWLVLTDREAEALSRWNTPSETTHIQSATIIERGKPLTALIIFSGCAADNRSYCDLTVKFRVLEPSGRVSADLPYQEVWVGKPAPPRKILSMGVGYIRVVVEPSEPLGKWQIHADIFDRNSNKRLHLQNSFEAVEINSQHNKPLNKDASR